MSGASTVLGYCIFPRNNTRVGVRGVSVPGPYTSTTGGRLPSIYWRNTLKKVPNKYETHPIPDRSATDFEIDQDSTRLLECPVRMGTHPNHHGWCKYCLGVLLTGKHKGRLCAWVVYHTNWVKMADFLEAEYSNDKMPE